MDEIELADLRMDGLQLLSQLPGEDQLIFVLYHFLELTQAEIAGLEGVHKSTICRRLAKIDGLLTLLACNK